MKIRLKFSELLFKGFLHTLQKDSGDPVELVVIVDRSEYLLTVFLNDLEDDEVAVGVEKVVILDSWDHGVVLFAFDLSSVDELEIFLVALFVNELEELRGVFIHFRHN